MNETFTTPLNLFEKTGFFNNISLSYKATEIFDTNLSQNNGYVNNHNSSQLFNRCAFEQPPLTNVRFWIVTVFGTAVSIISIVENSFFFFLFLTRKHHRTTYNMYMMFLTFFDIFVSGAYVLLMSTNVLSDYLQHPSLVKIWFNYMVPILTMSHCGITSSTFLLLAATFERYCISDKPQWVHFVQKHRRYIILSAILLGIISKGSICFEFKIWRFWYRNFVTIFFPFFALLALNIQIVKTLAKAERQSISINKKVAQNATWATVLVVFTYLISNIINVILTTWEHIDKTLLVTDYVQVYAIALDLVSLLTNLASAFRPPIYLICQPTLRSEVFTILKHLCVNDRNQNVLKYNIQTIKESDNKEVITTKEMLIYNFLNKCNKFNNKIVYNSLLKNDNQARMPISVMDLLKDEADFIKDNKSLNIDSTEYGKLEAIAARTRYKKENKLTNTLNSTSPNLLQNYNFD